MNLASVMQGNFMNEAKQKVAEVAARQGHPPQVCTSASSGAGKTVASS